MKKFVIFFALSICLVWNATAQGRESFIQYLPRNSFMVAGADFQRLQGNEVYLSMQKNNQLWSFDEGTGGVTEYLKLLEIDTQKDIQAFAFSKYINNYGESGKIHIFHVNKDLKPALTAKTATPYLQNSIYRLTPDKDMYAVLLTPSTICFGNLNETKMAVDVSRSKVPAIKENDALFTLYGKIPSDAPIWGASIPLSRRKAADAKAKQSTNSIISGFQNYYFYGVPTKTAARTQFFGQAEDEKQAEFITSFMIGTLLVTKLRADQTLGEMLDQVDVKHNGNVVHVTMVITKEMVDAYYKGKLGF
jgi:hypothetical protein